MHFLYTFCNERLMMTRYILVLVLLFGIFGNNAYADDPRPIKGETVKREETENCTAIQATMKAVGTDPEAAKQLVSKVSVYLSEKIANDPNHNYYGMSCSQIIFCMRSNRDPSKFKGPSGSFDGRLQEASLIDSLRGNFPACILEGTDGLDLLRKYASEVYQWIAGIVGAICILIIVVSGIQISMGGVSQEEVSAAKERITRSLVGLVVLFLSAFILYTINPIFFS